MRVESNPEATENRWRAASSQVWLSRVRPHIHAARGQQVEQILQPFAPFHSAIPGSTRLHVHTRTASAKPLRLFTWHAVLATFDGAMANCSRCTGPGAVLKLKPTTKAVIRPFLAEPKGHDLSRALFIYSGQNLKAADLPRLHQNCHLLVILW